MEVLASMNKDPLVVSVPSKDFIAALGVDTSQVNLIEWDMTGPPPLNTIDIAVPPYMGAQDTLVNLEGVNVRLVQGLTAGYDGVAEVLPKNMVYANAASVHETSTSELTLALILASQRGIPDFVRAAEKGHWARAWHESLADRTVLLVGYGGVGKAIESRLLAFEAIVVRVARTERSDERGVIHAFGDLPSLLADADIVVVVVPLTDETTNLVDDAFLSHMRDGALLVNVARGPVADTDALLAHAKTGRIRLALDVTDPEPLPDGHPLFALENVLISPHVGGATSAALPRMARLLQQQIARMQNDEEPLNVVLRT
jgi:phosphoglycerate dehydrogenase-like enzyme